MKSKLKTILPPSTLKLMRQFRLRRKIVASKNLDGKRYYVHSRSLDEATQLKLKAAIVANYHVLEKGLAMPERKAVFGESVAKALVQKLRDWKIRGYDDNVQIRAANSVLSEYVDATGGVSSKTSVSMRELHDLQLDVNDNSGGTRQVNKEDFLRKSQGNFAQLAEVRRSVRDYSETEVPAEIIQKVVELAQNSPSVCNRQACSVFWTTDSKEIDFVLGFQNGNRGFGHLAKGLFIVTSNLNVFQGEHERNQAWVDGGLFSMSLLYSLSFFGLGACPLNWCVDGDRDSKLRASVNVPDSHEIIMLISFGFLKDKFSIAASARNEVSEVMHPLRCDSVSLKEQQNNE